MQARTDSFMAEAIWMSISDVSCRPDDVVPKVSNDLLSDSGNEAGYEELVHCRQWVDLNRISQMLRWDLTSSEPWERRNVNHILIEQEMDEVEVKAADPNTLIYGGTCTRVKNAPTKHRIAVANPWTCYRMVSQPTDDRSTYKGQVFVSKEDVVYVVRTLSIKSPGIITFISALKFYSS